MEHTKAARDQIRPSARSLHREKQALKGKSGDEIGSVGALHIHALAIAHEAIARYQEFAAHVADHGNDVVVELFSRLAKVKAEHAFPLAEVAAGMVSPKLAPGAYAWLNNAPLLPEAHDFIFRMMTPRQALEIAVRAEERAKAFFEQVLAGSNDVGVRELAIELGRDEDSNIAWLQDALARVPKPFRPNEDCPGDPATPQAL